MLHPEQKLRIAGDLHRFARELKAAGLRAQHPNWPEDKIVKQVKETFLYART